MHGPTVNYAEPRQLRRTALLVFGSIGVVLALYVAYFIVFEGWRPVEDFSSLLRHWKFILGMVGIVVAGFALRFGVAWFANKAPLLFLATVVVLGRVGYALYARREARLDAAQAAGCVVITEGRTRKGHRYTQRDVRDAPECLVYR